MKFQEISRRTVLAFGFCSAAFAVVAASGAIRRQQLSQMTNCVDIKVEPIAGGKMRLTASIGDAAGPKGQSAKFTVLNHSIPQSNADVLNFANDKPITLAGVAQIPGESWSVETDVQPNTLTLVTACITGSDWTACRDMGAGDGTNLFRALKSGVSASIKAEPLADSSKIHFTVDVSGMDNIANVYVVRTESAGSHAIVGEAARSGNNSFVLSTELPQNSQVAGVAVDNTGQTVTSESIRVPAQAGAGSSALHAAVFNNPAKNGKNPIINITAAAGQDAHIRVFDGAGHVRLDERVATTGSTVQYVWRVFQDHDIASGIYKLVVTVGSDVVRDQIAVVK